MKSKLIQNLSANTLQLVFNQVLGVGIFLLLSTSLSKTDFGRLNLALAILLAIFSILSVGMDQLIIKKIAAGGHKQQVLSLYVFHVLFAGTLFALMLLAGWLILPTGAIYNLILFIGIGKLLLFFSTPFKQVTSGLEQFKLLAYMLLVSNVVRFVGLIILLALHSISLRYLVGVFIIGDALELLLTIYLFKKANDTIAIKWYKSGYLALLREAIPQSGVVIITAALARLDWILIGLFLSATRLAEYSFAYKIFEMATLPLLAIAPLLIPRFTKVFSKTDIDTSGLQLLLKAECIIAAFIGLLLNICWAPVVDAVTAGKYGAVNTNTIFILSLCMPLLYVQNFFWTIFFAQGRLKMILHSFIITLTVNVVADVILIPLYQNEGAAAGFLLSCSAQVIFFLYKNKLPQFSNSWQPLVMCTLCALGSGYVAKLLFRGGWLALPACIVFYMLLLFITGILKFKDKEKLKLALG
ncbi:oligosaccharide flippase family protein [Mucilaginibacter calamicampi]|uniref:Oligosaccharide flippase family protein n=1 Tax=Mucilaginibacter calamicampi TaxID=1302352 RepID=A0ABW2YVU5_9SPHI